jgi:2-dehydropantoate 2-reductase
MRILVIGAGVIGSFNAARLHGAGHEVALLARGRRLAQVRERGVELEDALSGARSVERVTAVEVLAPDDAYDLVVVAVRHNQIASVLPILAASQRTPIVLVMGNSASGPAELSALGTDRVLRAQANLGGELHDGVVRYLWASWLPLEFCELDERPSPRGETVIAAFARAGITARRTSDFDASLRTHVVTLAPIAAALYAKGGDVRRLAHSRTALRLWVQASREGLHAMRATRRRIVPPVVRAVDWLPEWLMVYAMGRFLDTRLAEVGLGGHANAAVDEVKDLADALRRDVLGPAGLPTPASDRLYRILDARYALFAAERRSGAPGASPAST